MRRSTQWYDSDHCIEAHHSGSLDHGTRWPQKDAGSLTLPQAESRAQPTSLTFEVGEVGAVDGLKAVGVTVLNAACVEAVMNEAN